MFLQTYLSCKQVDDFKSVFDNAHGHDLLAVVASVHHKGAGEALHDGALSLAETFDLIAASRVREELCILLLDGNVILKYCVRGYHNADFKIHVMCKYK